MVLSKLPSLSLQMMTIFCRHDFNLAALTTGKNMPPVILGNSEGCIYLSICLSVCLSVCVCLSVRLSIYLSIYMTYKKVTLLPQLLYYLNHELVFKKVHRVIKFNQNAWLKPYIGMITDLRKKGKMILKKTFLS